VKYTASGPSPTCDDRNIETPYEWGVLKTTAIQWTGWKEDEHKTLPEEFWGAKHLEVRKGDVLVTKAGPRHRVGVSVYVGKTQPRLIVSGKMIMLRVDESAIDPRYLNWQLATPEPQAYLNACKSGMAEAQMNYANEDLLGMEIKLPPLDVQRRIADFLDAEMARIDILQAVRYHQLAALEELASSRISAIVPSKSEVSYVRLGYLAVIQSGITVDSNRNFGTDSVTLPYLRVANVQDGHVDLGSVSKITVPRSAARPATLRRGDVLMTEGGDLDKLGRGTVWLEEIKNCLHQNHVFAVRPDQRKLVPEYLALLTRTSYARSYFESTGTKTTNLASTSSSKIRDFKIPLIDVTDQTRIFRDTDAWLKDIAKVEAALTQQSSLLTERRQALITAAVSGQIDVTTARGGAA
jgi:type I restriction enzyme S subunit